MHIYEECRERLIDSLTKRYVVVFQPKIHLLMHKEHGAVARITRKAFGEMELSNYATANGKKFMGAKVFIDAAMNDHPNVRGVHEVIWDPAQPIGMAPRTRNERWEPGYNWNLFLGWPKSSAINGNLELLLGWLKDFVTSGDMANYLWLENYLAHMLQRPAEQPGVGIALPDTCTSNIFANELLRKLVGEGQWGELSHGRHVATRLYEQSIVLKSFESVPDKLLRQLVLDPTRPIKRAFGGKGTMKNAVRVFVMTWDEGYKEPPFSDTFMRKPLNKGVFRCLQTKFEDEKEYNIALDVQDELNKGAVDALRHHLLNLPNVTKPTMP